MSVWDQNSGRAESPQKKQTFLAQLSKYKHGQIQRLIKVGGGEPLSCDYPTQKEGKNSLIFGAIRGVFGDNRQFWWAKSG